MLFLCELEGMLVSKAELYLMRWGFAESSKMFMNSLSHFNLLCYVADLPQMIHRHQAPYKERAYAFRGVHAWLQPQESLALYLLQDSQWC